MNIPGFEMIEKLGQGGMATVWKARQVSLDRIVAIKILSTDLTEDPEDVKRFQTEAQSAAKLNHPGIVQVYDAQAEGGVYYFVMEYVAGYTVGDWLRRSGPISEKDALLVVQCVAEALGYAWEKERIIHCDVKPDNIIIDADGAVKVADLGLARTISSMSTHAVAEEVLGTPAYLSPEQASGRLDLDCRADIYSLGAMLYHLVTGVMLFEGHHEEKVMDLQILETVSDPLDINPALSPSICWVIEKMLVKDRDGRYDDWNAVQLDLAKVKKKLPISGRPAEGASTVQRSVKRITSRRSTEPVGNDLTNAGTKVVASKGIPVPVKIAAGIACLGIVFAGFMFMGKNTSSPQPRRVVHVRQDPVPVTNNHENDETYGGIAQRNYDDAVKWAEKHGDDYDESIRLFKRIIITARGTRYAVKSEARIREITISKNEAARAVMERLKRNTDTLVRDQKYNDAIKVYNAYNGKLANAIRASRVAVVARLNDLQKKKDEEAREFKDLCATKLDDLLNNVMQALVEDGVQDALDVLNATSIDPIFSSMTTVLNEMKTSLKAANNIDAIILESFVAQKGANIQVCLTSGKKVLTIMGVRDDRVTAFRNIRGVRVKTSFGVQDLAITERLRRMGDDDNPEVALVKGLMALHSQAFPHARRYFEKTFAIFSVKLMEYVERAENGVDGNASDEPITLDVKNVVQPDPVVAKHPDKPIAQPKILDKPVVSVDMILTKLRAINPELQPQEVAILSDKSGVVYKVNLTTPAVRNIEPLALLTGLRDVSLGGNYLVASELKDISPLEGLPLESLSVTFSSVKSLAALKKMKLTKLNISHTEVQDMLALRGMPLKRLDAGYTKIKDLQDLKGMSLEFLNIDETKVIDIRELKGMPLSNLSLCRTSVRDISWLKNMPLLSLNISNTKTFDINPLRGMSLRFLDLSFTQVRDISVLEGMPLEHLNLTDSNVANIKALKGMKLISLALSETSVKDLSVIAGMPLNRLEVAKTKVTDLVFLVGMPLTHLNVADTGVSELAPIRGMNIKYLDIHNTRINDLSPIAEMPLQFLDCRGLKPDLISALAGSSVVRINVDQPDKERVVAVLRTMPKLGFVNGQKWFRWKGGAEKRRPGRRKRDNRR